MKRPSRIITRPLDIFIVPKIDLTQLEDGDMLIYVPRWIVRAYKLRSGLQNKIWLDITDKNRTLKSLFEKKEHRIISKYFGANWSKKLNKERRERDRAARK
jgi:hypothetical protein